MSPENHTKHRKKVGQATLHESLLFYFVHVRKQKTKTEKLIFGSFFTQPYPNSNPNRQCFSLLSLLLSIFGCIASGLVLWGRCESRLKEPAVRLGLMPPCCGGTTKCRQNLGIFYTFIFIFYFVMEFFLSIEVYL